MISAMPLAGLFSSTWLMPADRIAAHIAAVQSSLRDGDVDRVDVVENVRQLDRVDPFVREGVAILSLRGVLEQRTSLMGWLVGGTSTEVFSRQFQTALGDPDVRAIVIEVDSPGGTYPGIPELGREVYEGRGAKGEGNIVAIANSLAASGALWLATAAERFVITPSGEAGSIGAVMVHSEMSQAFEDAGIGNTVIRRPEAKAERNIYEPLSDEAQQHAQQVIDEIYEEFVQAVAIHRGVNTATVRDNFGEGRMLSAKQAVAVGLADGIATVGQVVGSLINRQDNQQQISTAESRKLRRRRVKPTEH